MDFRDILKSFDNLSEGEKSTTDKGTVHKATAGGYGNQHGTDDVKDQYGKPIGKVSLGKLGAQNEPKRGKGRPPNPDKAKSYDSSALSKAMGMGKAPKATGKPSVKHSLKEYFDQMDEALSEAGLSVQPIPGQKQLSQNFMIKDPANPQAAAITTSDPAVVNAAKQGTLSMQKPGAAPTQQGATPTTGAGSQVGAMAEGGDVGKHNNATTGFEALVRKLTPKYGKEAAMKIAGAQLKKIKEAEAPQHFAQSSPLSTANRGVLEGKKGVNPFAKKDDKDAKKDDKAEKIGKKVTKDIEKVEEGSKPDFLDLDKDGNKKEPMKAAAKDKKKVKEGMDHKLQAARLEGKSHALRKMPYSCSHDDMEEARHYHEGFKEGLDECYGQMPIIGRTAVGEMGQGPEVATMASYGAHDMDEGNAFTAGLAKTPHGGKFNVGGSTFTDRTRYDSNLDEFAFESLDKQLNAILEGKDVTEGMTVSISKGQQGSPDSVSVSAQDGEADQLLSIIKSSGMGLFGGDEQNGYGAPQGSTQAPGGIEVVDDHDGMMALMKKLSGGGEVSGGDYESEEGHSEEEHMHGEEGHSHEGEEEPCNECGMAYESCGCDHGDEEVVDEQETEDQMMYNVAEEGAQNTPDNGSANASNATQGNAAANASLAVADAGDGAEEPVAEDDKEDTTGEEAGEESEEDDEEKVEEGIYESYANSADDTFEADIDFMTKVISGGLNKMKSTGQTTVPVIAGQKNRMGADGLGSPMKESTDLLKDYLKLSGL